MKKNQMSANIVRHAATVTRARREAQNGHRGIVIWLTGLSGSGKSTLGHLLEETLHQMGCRTFVLDGDNVRHGLCADLGFSDQDREENIRRIGEVSNLFIECGTIVICAFISPFRSDRERAKKLIGAENFCEIYCRCPLDVCEQRDVKGLYKKARQGLIAEFTGISSPYEEPLSPDLIIDTSATALDEAVQQIIQWNVNCGVFIRERGVISRSSDNES